LSLDAFTINVAGIDTPRIECYVIFDRIIPDGRIVVAPGSVLSNFVSYLQRIVYCEALKLAVTLMI
jgi:hypothetical protein